MTPRYTDDCLRAAQDEWPASGHGTARGARPVGIRVFESPFIEHVLGKAHPITPILWFGPWIAYGVYAGWTNPACGPLSTVPLYLAGWLAWTFLEYCLHRWVFHFRAESPDEKLRFFLIHGYHHEFPSDPLRLVAPPMMSWPLGAVVAGIYILVLGHDHWLPVFAGTATGYIAYDWIHYYTHHFRPRRGVGKWLRAYHMRHHYEGNEGRYGVSSPLWDLVFGTFRPLEARRQAAARVGSPHG